MCAQRRGGTIDFGGGPLVNKGDADVFLARLDPLGSHRFSRTAGDVDQQLGTSVVVDKSGNTISVGYFKGTIDLGGGPLSSPDGMFVATFGP